tara:strand:+ start:446 stop:580 length:135 start_codon:yes stop_codon:yes gene_type:complete
MILNKKTLKKVTKSIGRASLRLIFIENYVGFVIYINVILLFSNT